MKLQSLHDTYCRLTRGTVKFAIWQRGWWEFDSAGFTEDDLRCYIQYLQRENQRMNNAAYSLALHKILDGEFRQFDSMLSLARAAERNRRPAATPKEQALQQLRPETTEPIPGKVIPIGDALRKAVNGLP